MSNAVDYVAEAYNALIIHQTFTRPAILNSWTSVELVAIVQSVMHARHMQMRLELHS